MATLNRGFLPGTDSVACGNLAIVAAWGIAGLIVALARFHWAPAGATA
ncbi:MAG TPA: hypothetical protein VEF89_01775 [Solirubrobacteraceae bacterium]|nr:hypothetical protein [Solirubrobacteraceae bacterium]